ncbi:BTAD domain-containing putative transcriptional regulator [Streptomyces sp. NPDC001536]|uniref:AfsR/SARP family transcriptional regulator n=1 Tax=Streptomyces sp. NPDC001536 TaxID=3364583 RepID=UPI0036D0DE99
MGIWHEGQRLGHTTPQQRSVLSALLLNSNQVVPVESMVRALWGEKPPNSARNAVQGYISKLRRILDRFPESEITTHPQGYSLGIDKEQVDLHRFRRLVDMAQNADAVTACELLDEALDLWHGPPLSGVAGQWLPSTAGTYMEEERLSALEEHATATLEAGRVRDAIRELTSLVIEHPLRERAASLLMTALHRSGRRGDALTVFRDTRRHLVKELGIEPGSILRNTHQQVLSDFPGVLRRGVRTPQEESTGVSA